MLVVHRYIRSKCYLHRKKARGLCPILCEMDLGNSMSYMILQIAWFSVINPLENKMALRKTADKDGLLLCSHHFFFNFTMYPSLAFFKNKGPFQAGAFFIRPLGMLTMVENGSASLFSWVLIYILWIFHSCHINPAEFYRLDCNEYINQNTYIQASLG